MAAEPDDELMVVVPPAHQAGVWANDAVVQSSAHEVTVDLLRVDHSVEPNIGTVVARVAMSPVPVSYTHLTLPTIYSV